MMSKQTLAGPKHKSKMHTEPRRLLQRRAKKTALQLGFFIKHNLLPLGDRDWNTADEWAGDEQKQARQEIDNLSLKLDKKIAWFARLRCHQFAGVTTSPPDQAETKRTQTKCDDDDAGDDDDDDDGDDEIAERRQQEQSDSLRIELAEATLALFTVVSDKTLVGYEQRSGRVFCLPIQYSRVAHLLGMATPSQTPTPPPQSAKNREATQTVSLFRSEKSEKKQANTESATKALADRGLVVEVGDNRAEEEELLYLVLCARNEDAPPDMWIKLRRGGNVVAADDHMPTMVSPSVGGDPTLPPEVVLLMALASGGTKFRFQVQTTDVVADRGLFGSHSLWVQHLLRNPSFAQMSAFAPHDWVTHPLANVWLPQQKVIVDETKTVFERHSQLPQRHLVPNYPLLSLCIGRGGGRSTPSNVTRLVKVKIGHNTYTLTQQQCELLGDKESNFAASPNAELLLLTTPQDIAALRCFFLGVSCQRVVEAGAASPAATPIRNLTKAEAWKIVVEVLLSALALDMTSRQVAWLAGVLVPRIVEFAELPTSAELDTLNINWLTPYKRLPHHLASTSTSTASVVDADGKTRCGYDWYPIPRLLDVFDIIFGSVVSFARPLDEDVVHLYEPWFAVAGTLSSTLYEPTTFSPFRSPNGWVAVDVTCGAAISPSLTEGVKNVAHWSLDTTCLQLIDQEQQRDVLVVVADSDTSQTQDNLTMLLHHQCQPRQIDAGKARRLQRPLALLVVIYTADACRKQVCDFFATLPPAAKQCQVWFVHKQSGRFASL